MGNLCGKESSPDPFSQPGRILSSAPPPKTTSSLPRTVGGPAQRLGSNSPTPAPQTDAQQADARRKAAEAAEARANAASKSKGRLEKQLQEQKKQTRVDTLGAASQDERRQREVDAAQESRTYN